MRWRAALLWAAASVAWGLCFVEAKDVLQCYQTQTYHKDKADEPQLMPCPEVEGKSKPCCTTRLITIVKLAGQRRPGYDPPYVYACEYEYVVCHAQEIYQDLYVQKETTKRLESGVEAVLISEHRAKVCAKDGCNKPLSEDPPRCWRSFATKFHTEFALPSPFLHIVGVEGKVEEQGFCVAENKCCLTLTTTAGVNLFSCDRHQSGFDPYTSGSGVESYCDLLLKDGKTSACSDWHNINFIPDQITISNRSIRTGRKKHIFRRVCACTGDGCNSRAEAERLPSLGSVRHCPVTKAKGRAPERTDCGPTNLCCLAHWDSQGTRYASCDKPFNTGLQSEYKTICKTIFDSNRSRQCINWKDVPSRQKIHIANRETDAFIVSANFDEKVCACKTKGCEAGPPQGPAAQPPAEQPRPNPATEEPEQSWTDLLYCYSSQNKLCPKVAKCCGLGLNEAFPSLEKWICASAYVGADFCGKDLWAGRVRFVSASVLPGRRAQSPHDSSGLDEYPSARCGDWGDDYFLVPGSEVDCAERRRRPSHRRPSSAASKASAWLWPAPAILLIHAR